MITFWILAIIFGMPGVGFTFRLMNTRINKLELVVWVTSVVVAAISIGVITAGGWGEYVLFFK